MLHNYLLQNIFSSDKEVDHKSTIIIDLELRMLKIGNLEQR